MTLVSFFFRTRKCLKARNDMLRMIWESGLARMAQKHVQHVQKTKFRHRGCLNSLCSVSHSQTGLYSNSQRLSHTVTAYDRVTSRYLCWQDYLIYCGMIRLLLTTNVAIKLRQRVQCIKCSLSTGTYVPLWKATYYVVSGTVSVIYPICLSKSQHWIITWQR